MNEDLYIGIDLGTTAVKAGLFDRAGNPLAVTAREFRLDTPAPGFVEFDADRYLALAFDAVREVLASGSLRSPSSRVRAIGLSSQAQTFVLLDEHGRPIRPAVSWLDVRGGQEARDLSVVASRLGLEAVNAIDSGPKVLWLRRHEPDTLRRARQLVVIPDYLILRLTGRAVTDPGTAQATAVYDVGRGRWIDDLVAACGLRAEMLPEVKRPGEIAGCLTPEAARELGLAPDCLVAVGANDQSVGALGAGNVVPGGASVTLGTALAIILTSARGDGAPPGIGVAPHPAPGLFTWLAFAKTAGIVLRWFRDTLAASLAYDRLFEEIASVPIGCDGLTCLPHFSGTATPHFNPGARGAFAGLTLAHGRAHLARAIVESLAFTIRENLELLALGAGHQASGTGLPGIVGPSARGPENGVRPRPRDITESDPILPPHGLTSTVRCYTPGIGLLRAIGGGAQSDVWLQMIADVTGAAVERPVTREAACLGAAELAMVAAGRFPSVAEASLALYCAERRFEPDGDLWSEYDSAYRRYRDLYRTLYGAQGERES
jgi:xylulokinase